MHAREISAVALASCLIALPLTGGCESSRSTSANDAGTKTSAALLPSNAVNETCPITGEPIDETSVAMLWQGHPVAFASDADRRQFESLPEDKQHEVVEDGIRASHGTVNARCPVTGALVGVDAPVVAVEGYRVALLDRAALRQWETLPEEQRVKLITSDILETEDVANLRCPITDEWVTLDSPLLDVGRYTIAFHSDADRRQWQALPESARQRLLAEVVD